MKKKTLKKQIKDLLKIVKMKEGIIARLEELNKQGLSKELERGFNDLLNAGVGVSGPIPVHIDENMLSSEEIAAIHGISAQLEQTTPTITTGGSLPKEQSSAEIWKEWVDKTESKKGVFDHPKYRSPFFKINTFTEIERAKENEAPMEFHTNSEIKDDHIAGNPI